MTFDPSIAEISKSKVVPKKKYASTGLYRRCWSSSGNGRRAASCCGLLAQDGHCNCVGEGLYISGHVNGARRAGHCYSVEFQTKPGMQVSLRQLAEVSYIGKC